jgi:hypothetical protein
MFYRGCAFVKGKLPMLATIARRQVEAKGGWDPSGIADRPAMGYE